MASTSKPIVTIPNASARKMLEIDPLALSPGGLGDVPASEVGSGVWTLSGSAMAVPAGIAIGLSVGVGTLVVAGETLGTLGASVDTTVTVGASVRVGIGEGRAGEVEDGGSVCIGETLIVKDREAVAASVTVAARLSLSDVLAMGVPVLRSAAEAVEAAVAPVVGLAA